MIENDWLTALEHILCKRTTRWMRYMASMTLWQVMTGVLFARTVQQSICAVLVKENTRNETLTQRFKIRTRDTHTHTLEHASRSWITFQYSLLFIIICLSNIVFVENGLSLRGRCRCRRSWRRWPLLFVLITILCVCVFMRTNIQSSLRKIPSIFRDKILIDRIVRTNVHHFWNTTATPKMLTKIINVFRLDWAQTKQQRFRFFINLDKNTKQKKIALWNSSFHYWIVIINMNYVLCNFIVKYFSKNISINLMKWKMRLRMKFSEYCSMKQANEHKNVNEIH